ncbi:long-chain-fatty-acid--CoA ligase [Microvirga pakistanensis]|uniref:long-chain-fatty-acid--CoA ligase n=1 Tax=Microvirga pakistanensis TaxID=1682650 RepID=UPI00141B8682|nr:long-chain-fatty-acid--CoA ligase [Microvirga pakistanensis]
MMDVPLLLSSILDYAADWHGDTEIVARRIDGSIIRSNYGRTRQRVSAFGSALEDLGVAHGERVASLCWNTLEHFELFYSVPSIGAVLHTVNPRLSDDHIIYILNHGGARTLVFDPECAPIVMRVLPRLASIQNLIFIDEDGPVPDFGRQVLSYESLIAAHPTVGASREFDERSGAVLCYTSGTTGNPKGVLYTHRSLVLIAVTSIAKDFFARYGNGQLDTYMPIAGVFHATGWSFPHTAPISGSRLVLPGRAFDAASLCELIETERVNIIGAVPTVLQTMREHLEKKNQVLDSLTTILCSGAPVPAPLIRYFEEVQGADLIQTWGMTESLCSSRGTLRPGASLLPAEQRVLSGRASWGTRIRIADDNDVVLPNDGTTIGHLQVRGPWSANGYFNEPASPLTDDGWLRTGDMATIDATGGIRIRDRSKDVIKSGGEWISSVEIEAQVIRLPGVRHAAVIAIPHPRWQERPLLILQPETGATVDKEAVMAHLSERVAKWWLPDRIEEVAEMPLSSTGKILKSELRKQFPA